MLHTGGTKNKRDGEESTGTRIYGWRFYKG